MAQRTIKLYSDYKSPYAYLAKDLAYALEHETGVPIDWLPYTLDIPAYLGNAKVDAQGNVSEETLRTIAMNRTWMRKVTVAQALVKNPKTPPAISLHLLPRMNQRDIKHLSTDRNVPEALRLNAKKMMQKQADRQK